MIPKALFSGQKIVAIAFAINFVAGMNFYSLINCQCAPDFVLSMANLKIVFPLTFSTMYDPTPIRVGVKGIGYGISVTAGATIVNALMTILPKYNRELLLASCIVMSEFITLLR